MTRLITECPTDPTLAAAYVDAIGVALDYCACELGHVCRPANWARDYDLLIRHFGHIRQAAMTESEAKE